MEIQQDKDYFSNFFEHLVYSRHQPLTFDDYSNVNNTTNIIEHDYLPPDSRFHSRLGLRNMQRILNTNEPTAPSLVDVVREKNFQSHHIGRVASNQPSPAVVDVTEDRNQYNDMSGFEVNDLISWNTECELPISSKLAQLSLSGAVGDSTHYNGSFSSFANMKSDYNSDLQNCAADVNRHLDSSNSFNSSISNSDTDYSYFVAPTNMAMSWNIGSNKSNEYSLFSDCSSNSSSGSSNGTNNINYNNNNCATELSNAQPSNVSSCENSNWLQSPQLDPQTEVLNCISSMSKEQLEHMMRMIHETAVRNQLCASVNHREADKTGIQSSLLSHPQNIRPHSSVWNEELSQNLHPVPDLQEKRIPNFVNGSKDILELKAQNHHTAAVRGNVEASFTWNGELPKLTYDAPFANKIFVGGLPYQITEIHLISVFRAYGNLVVCWPGKENGERFKGFIYVIFENETQVKSLLKSCRKVEGNLFFTLPLKNGKLKDVQIIPWSILDNSYTLTMNPFMKLDTTRTVYVGALHGTMNARGLFQIMDDLFEGVIYAGICVDKHKYPTGSGRVIFDNYKSYVKAISAGFVNIKTPKFKKMLQLDPFIEDAPCSVCSLQIGPYFCRKNGCFRYFCSSCWKAYHKALRLSHNTPLKKNSKFGISVVNPMTIGFLGF